MASYNGAGYITQQIESVLGQEGVYIEILIRDDGSTDGTQGILEDFRKKRKIQWYQGKHLGVAFGFYELLERTRNFVYDYIAFCDQDDIWDTDKLKIALDALSPNSNTTPLLYYCGQRLVNEKNKLIGVHKLNGFRSMKARFILSDIAGCTTVLNKKLRDIIVMYKPSYMLMHDTWILKVCLAVGGKVHVDTEAHMEYRQHGNNTIGLGTGFVAKLNRAKKYIFDYKVEKQIDELIIGYKGKIVPEYEELVQCIKMYKSNRVYRKKLLDKNYIDFCDRGINLTYQIKVLLRKL